MRETAAAAVETVKKGEQEIMNLAALPSQWRGRAWEAVYRRAPRFLIVAAGRLKRWWHRERMYKVVEASLPYRKMDGLAADGWFFLSSVTSTLT